MFLVTRWIFNQIKIRWEACVLLGILRKNEESYADQQAIFEEVGREVIENFYQGYNCCLMAYGLKGTGKSYLMKG